MQNYDPAQIPPESPSLRSCPDLPPVPHCHQTQLHTSVRHSWARLPPPPGAFSWDHQPAHIPSSPPQPPYSKHQLVPGRAFCCEAPPPTGAFSWGQGVGAGRGHPGAGRKVPLLLPCTSPVYRSLRNPQNETGQPQGMPSSAGNISADKTGNALGFQ